MSRLTSILSAAEADVTISTMPADISYRAAAALGNSRPFHSQESSNSAAPYEQKQLLPSLLSNEPPQAPPSKLHTCGSGTFVHPTNDHCLDVDFVIPVKEVGAVLRAVVEGVVDFYSPRSIVFVASAPVLERILRLLPLWDTRGIPVRTVDETKIFDPIDVSFDTIRNEFEAACRDNPQVVDGVNPREFGWWYQQLIKLGAGLYIEHLSETYIVWDSDLIPLTRWPLFSTAPDGITRVPVVALLQAASKHPNILREYRRATLSLLGHDILTPHGNSGTFVAHHMPFRKEAVRDMLESFRHGDSTDDDEPWPLRIVRLARHTLRFSEYLTYATFAILRGQLDYHPFQVYGSEGLRFRGGGSCIDELSVMACKTENCSVPIGGFSHANVMEYVNACKHWSEGMAYLQLDHVYGLAESCYPPTCDAIHTVNELQC